MTFKIEGLKCETEIKSAGYGGATRGVATLFLGFVGFAATSGEKKDKVFGQLYMKEKGLRFIPEKDKYIEIRVTWNSIIHVAVSKYSTTMDIIYLYTNNDSVLLFKFKTGMGFPVKNIIESKCKLLKNDLEGWE